MVLNLSDLWKYLCQPNHTLLCGGLGRTGVRCLLSYLKSSHGEAIVLEELEVPGTQRITSEQKGCPLVFVDGEK